MVDEREHGQEDDEDFLEEEEDDSIDQCIDYYTGLEENAKVDYLRARLSQIQSNSITLGDLSKEVSSLCIGRLIYRIGLGTAIVAALALGVSTSVQSCNNSKLKDSLTTVSNRTAHLDSVAAVRGENHQVEDLIYALRKDSTYWHDNFKDLETRFKSKENKVDSLQYILNNMPAPTTRVTGYSKTELDKRVSAARREGKVSGYTQGLHEGEAKTIEQAFSLISEQVRVFDYTRMERPSSITYSVSQKSDSSSIQSYDISDIGVLQTRIDGERRIGAYTGELIGLGVKIEDIENFVNGNIRGIRLTKDPITKTVMSVNIENLEGEVTSYRTRRE